MTGLLPTASRSAGRRNTSFLEFNIGMSVGVAILLQRAQHPGLSVTGAVLVIAPRPVGGPLG